MDEEELPRIDTPSSHLPDLSELGIEEVDRGVCYDTFDNRQTLRAHKYVYRPVLDKDGGPTGLIHAISPIQAERNALATLDAKRFILKNPEKKNSDYISGYDLLMEMKADDVVPAWVLAATREWVRVEDRREKGEPNARPALAGPPGRCSTILTTGVRCQYWHGGRKGENGMCRVHLGKYTNQEANYVEKSRNRVKSAALAATEKLEQLLNAASEPVALKAATELLDRAGVRGGVEIDQNVRHEVIDATSLIAQRLKKLEESQKPKEELPVLEVEVIQDDRQ